MRGNVPGRTAAEPQVLIKLQLPRMGSPDTPVVQQAGRRSVVPRLGATWKVSQENIEVLLQRKTLLWTLLLTIPDDLPHTEIKPDPSDREILLVIRSEKAIVSKHPIKEYSWMQAATVSTAENAPGPHCSRVCAHFSITPCFVDEVTEAQRG